MEDQRPISVVKEAYSCSKCMYMCVMEDTRPIHVGPSECMYMCVMEDTSTNISANGRLAAY